MLLRKLRGAPTNERAKEAVKAEDTDIFRAFVNASQKSVDASPIISTDVMRAVIAYKWRQYGHRLWRWRLVEFGVFFVCYKCAPHQRP